MLGTPRTRDDLVLRDAVRGRLLAVEQAIVAFVSDKQSEGFSPAEIDQLYAVEVPLMMAFRTDGGRVKVGFDVQIVERAG